VAEREGLAKLEPLFFGRLTRALAGAATIYAAARLWSSDPSNILFTIVLGFLGVSFLVGGLLGHPGCEVTVLPNLLVRPEKRSYCV